MARMSRLLRARAMIDGRKYITNPKPKNGRKMNIERIMTALPFYSLALSRPHRSQAGESFIADPITTRPVTGRYASARAAVPGIPRPQTFRSAADRAFPGKNLVQAGSGFLGQVIRLLVGGILVRSHVRAKGLHRIRDQGSRISVAPHELCRWPKGQVQNVMKDEHLPVAFRTCANPDGRSANLGGNHSCNFPRNAFEEETGHAGTVEGHGIAHQLLNAAQALALHLVAAHHIDGLRGQADMPGHRNLGVDDLADQVGALLPSLDLHHFRS